MQTVLNYLRLIVRFFRVIGDDFKRALQSLRQALANGSIHSILTRRIRLHVLVQGGCLVYKLLIENIMHILLFKLILNLNLLFCLLLYL
jgi:hypothetical protein